MKHVLFFSCEPGGADVLIPIITLVTKMSYRTSVLAYGYASERFEKMMIPYKKTDVIVKDDTRIFDELKPDAIITSATSHPSIDMSEKYIWRTAKKLGIKTLAFLDQWQNYSARFSGINKNEKLQYLPDYINCINDAGRQEMLEEGFPGNRLLTFGHPYLSGIKSEAKKLDKKNLKDKLSLPEDRSVHLFISEPVREYYGGSRGYDQYEVLNFLLASLATVVAGKKRSLIVKLHPKDNPDKFIKIRDNFEKADMRFIQEELSSLECISIADYIYGMTSIMLIEAYVLDKMVLSLQPNLNIEDPLVLSRHNYINKITSCYETEFSGAFRTRCVKNEFTFQFLKGRFLAFLDQGLTHKRKKYRQ